MQARSEEVKVANVELHPSQWVEKMAVPMVDSRQALQEAKNAIAAKMGGGWP